MITKHSLGAAVAAAMLFIPSGATAVDKCKIKQDKSGTLLVSAQSVVGALTFGYSAERVVTPISVDPSGNACLASGSARNCALGSEGSDARTTLPPDCRLYLEDDDGICTAEIKRCSPGLRPACPPDMVRLGSRCIERTINFALEWGDAIRACHDRGRSLCTMDDLAVCDTINLGNGTPLTCGTVTDASGTLTWTQTSLVGVGENVFNFPVRYGGNNIMSVQPTSSGGMYDFFCCGPLGTR